MVSKLLLLSHGQASVERGFSINKEIEVENLHEQSVVGQRVVYDHVHSVGGILKVELTNGLLVSAGSARQRYHAYLDEQNAARQNEESKINENACLTRLRRSRPRRKEFWLTLSHSTNCR